MMKTKLFTLVFAVLVLGACKKEIKLDVKQIHLTDKTGQWDIKIDRLKPAEFKQAMFSLACSIKAA